MKIKEETIRLLNIHPDPIVIWGVYLSLFIGLSGIIIIIFYSILNNKRKRKTIPETLANKFLLAGTIVTSILLLYVICTKSLYIIAILLKNEDLQLQEIRGFRDIDAYVTFSISLIALTFFLIGFLSYLQKINSNQIKVSKKLDSVFLVLSALFLIASYILQLHYIDEEIGEVFIPSYIGNTAYDQTFKVYGTSLSKASIFLSAICIFIGLIILNRKLKHTSLINGKQPFFYSHYFTFIIIIFNQTIFVISVILHDISYTQYYNTFSFFYYAYIISEIIQYSCFIALFIELAIKIRKIDLGLALETKSEKTILEANELNEN